MTGIYLGISKGVNEKYRIEQSSVRHTGHNGESAIKDSSGHHTLIDYR